MGGGRFGLARRKERFPPILDEPLEDQPDGGTAVWGLTVCGGSEGSDEQLLVV